MTSTSASQYRASPYSLSRAPKDIPVGFEWKKNEDYFTILEKSNPRPEWKKGRSKCIKGPWTPEEDKKLVELVRELGAEKWVLIASRLSSRTGKQCRERWHNHLDPRIDKSPFTPEEEDLIFRLYAQMGSKWAEMSKLMPGRPDNAIKNYFNTTMQRKKRRMKSQPTNISALAKSNDAGEVKITLPPFRTAEIQRDTPLNRASVGTGSIEQRLYDLRHEDPKNHEGAKLAQPILPTLRFDTLMAGRVLTPPQTPENCELPLPLFKPTNSYEYPRPLLPSLTSSYLGLKINSPCMSSSQESPSSSSSSIGFPDLNDRSSDESEDEERVDEYREDPMRIDTICSS